MRPRLISSAVLVPVVVIVFAAGWPWIMFGFVLLAALAAFETVRLVQSAGFPASPWIAVPVASGATFGITYVVVGFFPSPWPFGIEHVLALIAGVVMVIGTLALGRRDPRVGLNSLAGNLIATLYPSLLAFCLAALAIAPFIPESSPLSGVLDPGRAWLLVLVLTVWSLDTFAYITGRAFPRGRFMNHISPNKTWSGAIGGTLAAMVVCTALLWLAGQNVLLGPGLGLLIAVAAQAGDLVESMLKRAAGTKDSGALIPGHGGILDRLDSFLFAGPALFAAFVFLGHLPR